MYHKLRPDAKIFSAALEKKNLIPAYYAELTGTEYLAIAFGCSKILPIPVSKQEQQQYAGMCQKMFHRSGKKVGDTIDNLTIQLFQMGRPPAIINVGSVSVSWESEKNFSISVGV